MPNSKETKGKKEEGKINTHTSSGEGNRRCWGGGEEKRGENRREEERKGRGGGKKHFNWHKRQKGT